MHTQHRQKKNVIDRAALAPKVLKTPTGRGVTATASAPSTARNIAVLPDYPPDTSPHGTSLRTYGASNNLSPVKNSGGSHG